MEVQSLIILLKLVIAHLLADFGFQSDKIAEEKSKGLGSRWFWIHLAIVGLTTYILLFGWGYWKLTLIVTLAHGLIDWVKLKIKPITVWVYIVDQLFHLGSVLLIWTLFYNIPFTWWEPFFTSLNQPKILLTIIGFLVSAWPLGYLIGYLTKSWQEELLGDKSDDESLPRAGKTIGIIERALVLIFVLYNHWEPIGFLLAAKSVFRFGDLKEAKDRKKTEYILIGTFMSFTFSIILGILIRYLLNLV